MKIFDPSVLALPLFDDSHRALATELEAWVDTHRDLPQEHAHLSAAERGVACTRLLGESGWLRHAIDPAPGRTRPDLRAVSLMREAFAYLDDLLDFAFAIQGLGAAPLAWYGSAAQQADYLGQMRSGRKIGALALSEPETGSNLAALAVPASRDASGFHIDGMKTWVSNGGIADHYAVLVRTGDGPGGLGLSFLLVDAATPGLRVEPIDLMAPRAFSRIHFDHCTVPGDALIGASGSGFRQALEILNFYRVTVGAAALGFSRRALRASLEWSRERKVAGGRLVQTQFTADKLANMAVYADSAALLVARAAWEFDQDRGDLSHASMAKLYATDGAARVADDALQLFGAAGLVSGSVPETVYRQVRSLRIYEGTSEIQKLIIAGALGKGGA